MTLQGKLDRVESQPVGFRVRTEEIAWLLGKALSTVGIKGNNNKSALEATMLSWEDHGESGELWVSVNHPLGGCGVFCDGTISVSGEWLEEIYEVTVEELEEYLGKGGE